MTNGVIKYQEMKLGALINGGLRIGSLKSQNTALLVKWWWRFKVEEGALWKKNITSLHGASGKLGEGSCAGVWGKIANLHTDVEGADFFLNSLFTRSLGNRKNTRFWLDTWCGSTPLASRFPN